MTAPEVSSASVTKENKSGGIQDNLYSIYNQ